MAVEYLETTAPLDEEIKGILKRETIEAESKLAKLIHFARELMLQPIPNAALDVPMPGDEDDLAHDVNTGERSGLGANLETTAAIEQFGADLIEEAFGCFGDDGPVFVKLFLNARSIQERINICRSVEERINIMSINATHQFEDEDNHTYRYSPIRLSPKLMGIYPNTILETTCLGKSILMTSFLVKAGIPTFHGGVILSSSQEMLIVQSEIIREILDSANHPEHSFPPSVAEGLDAVSTKNAENTMTHNGFHAATYGRIANGVWMQFDPNFGSSKITHSAADKLDAAYVQIAQLHSRTSLNAETRLIITAGDYFFADLAQEMGAALPSAEIIDDILLHTPASEVYSTLIEKIFIPLLPERVSDSPGDGTYENIKAMIDTSLLPAHGGFHMYMQLVFARLMEQYVFSDAQEGDILTCIERCKTDPNYRQRRVEDLCSAPLMMVLVLHSNWSEQKKHDLGRGGLGHPYIEVGLPNYRIGMSVLSDIAGYYDDELPLSSWLAYWPSDVSLAEHYKQTPTPAQEVLAKAAILHATRQGYLTYPVLGDILESS